MLCSHQKKFIFFKTLKTAGTSVEIFFEQYCVPPNFYSERHSPDEAIKETISNEGIVGSRLGGRSVNDKFYNHMPASLVLKELGVDIFDSYFKFTIVRNPFDKVVSMFWWSLLKDQSSIEFLKKLHVSDFDEVKKAFRLFILKGGSLPLDKDIYTINDQAVIDYFIRYENINEDLKKVCKIIGIPFQSEKLGHFKGGVRHRNEHHALYFDQETKEVVEDAFAWEIKHFAYSLDV
jgi:hypothetical protein